MPRFYQPRSIGQRILSGLQTAVTVLGAVAVGLTAVTLVLAWEFLKAMAGVAWRMILPAFIIALLLTNGLALAGLQFPLLAATLIVWAVLEVIVFARTRN